ncbi:MAG TPA: MMPL family transporter [Candidatus Thermoplasmatota archaeon]|nr:MMPL family transporter [Candidatus Thermoplasmatota archaeon]
MENAPVRLAQRLSKVVTRFPKATVMLFVLVAVVGASFLPGMKLYLSFYQLIPHDYHDGDAYTSDYYDHYEELNRDFGGDNWDYYIFRADNVTSVPVVREMNAVQEAVKAKFDYVEGTLSLAELVKIANYIATGSYEFPPEGPVGDQQIRTSLDALFTLPQYRNQIVGNLVSADNQTGLMVLILTQNEPLEQYRAYAADLKAFHYEIDENNPYQGASTMLAINVDTIYLKLDQVTFDEGLFWVALAFGAVLVVSLWLFRSPVFTAITLLNLTVVVSVTVAALVLAGGYLNLLTMLLIGLIFGVGDDYTTYALTIYRNERAAGHSLKDAILEAQKELASALLIAVLVTLSGFASIWLTGFPAIMVFGAMAAAGVLFAYLGALTLVPACLWLYFTAVERRKARRQPTAGYDRLMRHATTVQGEGVKLTAFALRWRWPILGVFGLLAVGTLSPLAWGEGVKTWGGSYSEIFDQDTYEMQAYNHVAEWMGIPIDIVVFVGGDPTDPAFLRMVDDLDQSMGQRAGDPSGIHSFVRADSLADVVRDNYPRYLASRSDVTGIPLPQEAALPVPFPGAGVSDPFDRDGDGLPDDRAFLRRMYEAMWDDPATTVLMTRVVDPGYTKTLVRVGINVETGDGLTPEQNARQSVRELESRVDTVRASADHKEAAADSTFQVSGLAIVLLAVHDSIEFGNQWTVIVMVTVIFGLVTLYYRRPIHTMLIMVPLLFGVAVQYFLMSLWQYEMTYVAVIVTSVDMGLGIDLGVHTYANFRRKMREGLEPKKAILEATGAINVAMIAALFTDMSAFLLIPWSDITWAAQTARILLASIAAILACAILVLPCLFYWDAKRNPKAYGAPAKVRFSRAAPE